MKDIPITITELSKMVDDEFEAVAMMEKNKSERKNRNMYYVHKGDSKYSNNAQVNLGMLEHEFFDSNVRIYMRGRLATWLEKRSAFNLNLIRAALFFIAVATVLYLKTKLSW